MHELSESLLRKSKRALIFWLAAAAIIILDQISKVWILRALAPVPGELGYEVGVGTRAFNIIPRLFRFQYAENTGAAFSLFQKYPEVLTVIACSLAAGVVIWCYLLPERERLSRLALGMIFGGAVGNIIDRFVHSFVVDFMQLHWDGRPLFPTFNVADSAICIGIGVFFLASWLAFREQTAKAKAAERAAGQES